VGCRVGLDAVFLFRRPRKVHQRPGLGFGSFEGIEELDRVLAGVACEVAVVAVDNVRLAPI